ncbi:MAG: hydroxyacylglutathione hydrolase [Burkholderiales bacterium]|nr:hydroxyacylglutathione hydrolase [Burkholderiales bacterium]
MSTIIPIPAFADNYIWVVRDGTRAAVVDPGDARPVLDYLAREGLTLAAVLATHHHQDHVGGIEALVARHPAPVYGPARETIPKLAHPLRGGDAITIPGMPLDLRILDIPGHTAGHIAYVGDVGSAPALFCGDTLFAAGCGRIFEGTPAQMWASLAKLAALAGETRVYCGHEYTLANLRFALAVEPDRASLWDRQAAAEATRHRDEPTLPSTIALERATNPFLRAGHPVVRAAAAAHAGHPIVDEVESFAVLRAWKNEFR